MPNIHDPMVVNAIWFAAAALLGQFLNAVKKWAEGEDWILVNLRATVRAVMGNLMIIGGMIGAGALAGINDWWAIVIFGLSTGFSADHALNKGQRREWTDEQRAAVQQSTKGAPT